MWMLTFGPLDEDILVCHKCDNPPRCNPEHLFIGTEKDNTRDMLAKGRNNPQVGTDRYNAVLTPDKIREIRSLRKAGEKLHVIAERIGVCKVSIWNVIHGKTWKHVT